MRANSLRNLKGMNVLKDIVLLGLLMVSCSSPSNSSTTPTPTSGGSTGVHIRVQQVTDLQCGSGIDGLSPFQNALILDGNNLTYDSVQLQQLVEYINNAFEQTYLPVPNGFKLVSIGLTGNQRQWNIFPSNLCSWVLRITNTGDTTIPVEQIQMRMLTNPQHNTYNLINICSLAITLASNLACPPGTARGGGPVDYTYKFKLGTENTSRVLQGSRNANPLAPFDPTLTPGKTVEVNIDFELSGNTQNMNYIIIPEITVDAIGGKQVIPQPQLKATLDIVTPRQLSCYTLLSDTNTFVQVPPGPQPKVWCL
ncbi:MAG TPA: hypothetical protein VEL31_24715 [Ktedonobacteraceae bacterium]|nr:hypothetical protein [Ktedonobacteraceae bacterium]